MQLSEESRSLAQEALSTLIGLPLSDMWRYFGYQKFEFGEQKPFTNRRGKPATHADWSLVVSCPWQIDGPDGFVLSWEHCEPPQARRDQFAYPFYDRLGSNPPIVEAVMVLEDGALHFELSDGFRLTLDTDLENAREYWRFMPPDDEPHGHLVLYPEGPAWSH